MVWLFDHWAFPASEIWLVANMRGVQGCSRSGKMFVTSHFASAIATRNICVKGPFALIVGVNVAMTLVIPL